MQQLWLVRHGPTTATESRSFGADEPLLPVAWATASRLAEVLPDGAAARCSPARRCRETAAAAGLAATVDPGLDQVDIGAWRGRSWAQVHDADPEAITGWLRDPAAAPHGGESLATLAARTGAWLDAITAAGDRLVAVTHSEIVRTVVLAALGAPLRAFWQLTVDPLSITELHRHDGTWTLQRLNAGLVA